MTTIRRESNHLPERTSRVFVECRGRIAVVVVYLAFFERQRGRDISSAWYTTSSSYCSSCRHLSNSFEALGKYPTPF